VSVVVAENWGQIIFAIVVSFASVSGVRVTT
jgi:hypothetical protein